MVTLGNMTPEMALSYRLAGKSGALEHSYQNTEGQEYTKPRWYLEEHGRVENP